MKTLLAWLAAVCGCGRAGVWLQLVGFAGRLHLAAVIPAKSNAALSRPLFSTNPPNPQETQQMLYAMRAPIPLTDADLSSPAKWRRPVSPFVIDVGANIGWFTLNAAAAGGRVAAFEGGLHVALVGRALVGRAVGSREQLSGLVARGACAAASSG